MIRRLLIANRGEIALRIIRACRELDIETVAVYSEADRGAPHVGAADRAIPIGPAPALSSYLSTPRLLDAVRESGADAVHPGYGFLAESASFAEACERSGVIFVGPPSDVIRRMGSKIAARQLMQSAGAPVVPGETPDDQTDGGVARAIERVGFPALVKASAGGGGRGMRELRERAEVLDAIQAARREALGAFGDGTLYVERLIDRPRHVEVQIVADHHGNVAHLFERDCSVQRRHQKVIEESPAPSLAPELCARMADTAVAAARAAGYRSAGTMEFLVEGRGDAARFYFLEANTRLQVEHPVTEAVIGVDLVRVQLLIASGERLAWTPASLTQRGHAIEARIYAEDPSRGFLPQAGPLLLYREPAGPGVRVDAGVIEGGTVSMHYDPLVAKVIAWAESRDLAIARLAGALRSYPILGVATNLQFLLAVLADPRFRAGEIDTGFLDREPAVMAPSGADAAPAHVLAAVMAHEGPASGTPAREVSDPWNQLRGWRA